MKQELFSAEGFDRARRERAVREAFPANLALCRAAKEWVRKRRAGEA